ncbi:MAG: hypothetical protein JXR76_30350 [Deltaproteobacteria bacterium]|nr:hypothetical protein [Deltaproteobacteria bacterium]
MLRKDWALIARVCRDLGMKVRLVTNGLFIDPQMVQRIMDAGVKTLSVSLDGDEKNHNAIRKGPAARQKSVYAHAIAAI